MAFRTNYRFERLERDRLKQAKKDEKLKRQQERATARNGAYTYRCAGAAATGARRRDVNDNARWFT